MGVAQPVQDLDQLNLIVQVVFEPEHDIFVRGQHLIAMLQFRDG